MCLFPVNDDFCGGGEPPSQFNRVMVNLRFGLSTI